MDLNDFWQEHKKFLTAVGAALLAFVLGLVAIEYAFGSELTDLGRQRTDLSRKLRGPFYSAANLDQMEAEHEQLVGSLEQVAAQVVFKPREDFLVEVSGSAAASRYHRVVSRVREALLTDADRRNMILIETLGLPKLSPTRAEDIRRTLEALDVIDRVVRLSLAEGVRRVDDIRIRLNQQAGSRAGSERVERTRITMELVGPERSLVRVLEGTQRVAPGLQPLTLAECSLRGAGERGSEAQLDLSIAIVRLAADLEAELFASRLAEEN